MVSALFNQPNYVATKKMLDATALRREAISANINNVEMPNYRRVDLAPSFVGELRQAMASQNASQMGALQPRLESDASAIANLRDGNTVQLESELVELNKTFVAHALETQLVSGALLRLRLAITGRS